MTMKAGTYEVLKVERESPFGYFLSDGVEDVLLHYSERNNEDIQIGDEIEVFLFNDHKGRVSATLHKPIIALGEVNFLKVKDFQPKMGFFLDNGLEKQVLIPIAELPEDHAIWPERGDKLLVKLLHDKQERLITNLIKNEEDIDAFTQKQIEIHGEPTNLPKSQLVDGIVIKHLTAGTKLYLENNVVGFLHKDEQLRELRLGENIKVRVAFIRDDGKLNITMKPLKEESRIEDADKILDILKSRGGAMPYWDKTPPDIIKKKFSLSKAAFKRALGKLMKDSVVYQEEGWTYLKNRDEL